MLPDLFSEDSSFFLAKDQYGRLNFLTSKNMFIWLTWTLAMIIVLKKWVWIHLEKEIHSLLMPWCGCQCPNYACRMCFFQADSTTNSFFSRSIFKLYLTTVCAHLEVRRTGFIKFYFEMCPNQMSKDPYQQNKNQELFCFQKCTYWWVHFFKQTTCAKRWKYEIQMADTNDGL